MVEPSRSKFHGSVDLNSEPRDKRKLGFGSFDARRRDEFTLDIRARQWKEKLRGEQIYVKHALSNAEALDIPSDPLEAEKERQQQYIDTYKGQHGLFQTQVPFNLYDIGRKAYTPICNKCARETFYCPHRIGRGTHSFRRPGTAPTTYSSYGNFDAMPSAKPKHGKVDQRKHFFDNSHLSPGW